MLSAVQLHIAGRHHTLLPPATFEAHRGEVLLVQADGQDRRTALALALTGRMKPSTGSVDVDGDAALKTMRARSAVVDAPEVNEPERHLTVRSLVAEDLALVPRKFRDRTRPTAWLVKRGYTGIVAEWVESLEPGTLLKLQLELALANQDIDLVVVDSPDRHTADDSQWVPLLDQVAAGDLGRSAGDDPRAVMVIGIVGRLPVDWTGPAVTITESGTAAPVDELDETPGVEPVETPVIEPVETPVVEPVETPVVEPVETPVVEPVETPEPSPTFDDDANESAAVVAVPGEIPLAAPETSESPERLER